MDTSCISSKNKPYRTASQIPSRRKTAKRSTRYAVFSYTQKSENEYCCAKAMGFITFLAGCCREVKFFCIDEEQIKAGSCCNPFLLS